MSHGRPKHRKCETWTMPETSEIQIVLLQIGLCSLFAKKQKRWKEMLAICAFKNNTKWFDSIVQYFII